MDVLRPIFLCAVSALSVLTPQMVCAQSTWTVTRAGTDNTELRFSYGTTASSPQYGVLQTKSSYLRLNTGPTSGWGTSIDTMPSFWSGGKLYQGTPVSATWSISGKDLVIHVSGTNDGLTVSESITIAPPREGAITAKVSAVAAGTPVLDSRPGEAFKPVFLSSMHESDVSFDSSSAFVGSKSYSIPEGGFLIPPAPVAAGASFGLTGGTSTWKANAPTVAIELNAPLQVVGWVTKSVDPNDDNVGMWAATDNVLSSWAYVIKVSNAR